MEDANTVAVLSQDFIQPFIAIRGFIQASSAQLYIGTLQPAVHHLGRYLTRADDLAGLSIALAGSFHPAHHATGTVNCAIEGMLCVLVLNTLQDDGVLAHCPAHKSLLTWEGWCRTLPHNPILLAAVHLVPSAVMVIVDLFENIRVQDLSDSAANPIPSGVGVFACQVHRQEILLTKVRVDIQDAGLDIHSILGTGSLQKPRRGLVSKAA